MSRVVTVGMTLALAAAAPRAARAQTADPPSPGIVDPFAPPPPPPPAPPPAPSPTPETPPPPPQTTTTTTTTATTAPTAPRRSSVATARPVRPAAGMPRLHYPRALAQRPLALPASASELDVDVAIGRSTTASRTDDREDLVLRGRFSTGRVEIEAGAEVFLDRQPELPIDDDRLHGLSATLRVVLCPDRTLSFGLEGHPAGKESSALQVRFAQKLHLSPRSAVEATALVHTDGGGTDFLAPSLSRRELLLGADVRAIAQVSERAALDVHAGYYFDRYFVDLPLAWSTSVDVGARATVAVLPWLDAVVKADVYETGARSFAVLTVGARLRRIP